MVGVTEVEAFTAEVALEDILVLEQTLPLVTVKALLAAVVVAVLELLVVFSMALEAALAL
jgi:hypothetical protein